MSSSRPAANTQQEGEGLTIPKSMETMGPPMFCRRITHAQHFYAPCAGRTTEEPSDSIEEDSTWSMINEEETIERQDQEES